MDVGKLTSGSSAFSKPSLNIWKFSFHVLLKPGLENFEHYFANVWDEFNCAVVWTFFGIALLWDWTENWPFPVLWLLMKVKEWKWSRSVVSDSLLPMDCSPPGSSIHGILQARILEWVTIFFSRGYFQLRTKLPSPALWADTLPLNHQGSPAFYFVC